MTTSFLPFPSPVSHLSALSPRTPISPLSRLSPASEGVPQQYKRAPSLSFSRPKLIKRHTTPADTSDASSLRSLDPIPEQRESQFVGPRTLRKHSSSGLLDDFKVNRGGGRSVLDRSSLLDERRGHTNVEQGISRLVWERGSIEATTRDLASNVLDAFGFPGDFQPRPKLEISSKAKKLETMEDRSFLPFEVPSSNEALFSTFTSQSQRGKTDLLQGRKARRETMKLPMQAPPPHMAYPTDEDHDIDMDKYDGVGWEMIPPMSSRVTGLSSVILDLDENEYKNDNRNRKLLDPYPETSWSSPNFLSDFWPTPTLRIGSDHPFHSHLSGWRGMEDILATDVNVKEMEEKAFQELESISSVLGVKQPVLESAGVGALARVISSDARSVRSWRRAMKCSRGSPVIQIPPRLGSEISKGGLVAERSALSPSFMSRSTSTHVPPLSSNIVNSTTRSHPPRGVPPKLSTDTSTDRVAEKIQLRSPISLHRQEASHSLNVSPKSTKSTLKMAQDDGIPIHQRPLPPLPAKAQSKTFLGSKPLARFLRSRGLSTSSDPILRQRSTKPVSPISTNSSNSILREPQSPYSAPKEPKSPKTPKSPTTRPLRRLSARDEPPARLPLRNSHRASPRRHDDLKLTAFSFLALNDPDNLSEPDEIESETDVVQHILPPQELSKIMDDHRARRHEEGLAEVEDEKSIRSTKADAGGWSSDEERHNAVRGSIVEAGWRGMKQRAEVQLKLDVGMENLAPHAISSPPRRSSSLQVDESGAFKKYGAFSMLPRNQGDREVSRGSLPPIDRRRRGPVPPARPMPRSTPPAMTLTTTDQRNGSVSLNRQGTDIVETLQPLQHDSPELQLSMNLDPEILDASDDSDSPSSTGATVGRNLPSTYDVSDITLAIADSRNSTSGQVGAISRTTKGQTVQQDFGSAFGGSVVVGYQNGIVRNPETEEVL